MSEKVTIKVERQTHHLPAIALRGLVVFPNNLVHFEVGRDKSIAAIEWAMGNNSNVFLVAQKKMDTDEPTRDDLFTYGVVAEIKQVLRVSDELVRVLVEGKYRARMTDLDDGGKFLLAAVQPAPVRGPKEEDALQTDAMVRSLKSVFDDYLALNQRLAKDVVFAIVSSDDPVFLSEYIPANLLFRYEDKQAVMDENTLTGRLEKLIELLRLHVVDVFPDFLRAYFFVEVAVRQQKHRPQLIVAEIAAGAFHGFFALAVAVNYSLDTLSCDTVGVVHHFHKDEFTVAAVGLVHVEYSMGGGAGTSKRIEN